MKYECLEEVGILDEAEYQGQKKTLSEIIMEVRKGGTQLFHGIEQGIGKNDKNVYVYFKGTMAMEVRDWIRKNYGHTITITNKKEYETSLPKITPAEKIYHQELHDYIINRMKIITIDSSSNKSRRTYLEAVTGKKKESLNEEVHEDNESQNTISKEDNTQSSLEEIDNNTQTTDNTAQMKMIMEL